MIQNIRKFENRIEIAFLKKRYCRLNIEFGLCIGIEQIVNDSD